MNKIMIAVAACAIVLTSGCTHTQQDLGLAKPVQVPDLPPALSRKASKLPNIMDNTMGTTVVDGANTDIIYNDVAWRLNHLIDFYNCIKTSINNKTEADCLK